MRTLNDILRESSARHKHLCPRQVLGVRMALYASELLDFDLPRKDKRLLVIAETDGCTVDGLIAATGCHVGGRTLRILDFGKVAATFTDVSTDVSLRIVPAPNSRSLAIEKIPNARNRWDAMLHGYQVLPDEKLFVVKKVKLNTSLTEIIRTAGRQAICDACGEEIINAREITNNGLILCRSCAGEGYFHNSVPVQIALKDSVDDPN